MSEPGTVPSHGQSPVVGKFAGSVLEQYRCAHYRRELLAPAPDQRAQVLVIPSSSGHVRMRAKADDAAVDMDLSKEKVRRDLPESDDRRYRERPGLRIGDELAAQRESGRPAVLLNGNNIGYWGNQYLIENGIIRHKRKSPLFDRAGQLKAHASGDHAFFVGADGGFRITNLALTVLDRGESPSAFDLEASEDLPDYGLSGYPVIRKGIPVWRDHAPLAWDPGLLFDEIGALSGRGYKYTDIRDLISYQLKLGSPLARHPITALGIDIRGDTVLLVAERRGASRGMSVADVAHVMLERYGVVDAIVLGAAGDAQLATTHEGFLVAPWVSSYSEASARPVPRNRCHPALRRLDVRARPVPSLVTFEFDPAPRWRGRTRRRHTVVR